MKKTKIFGKKQITLALMVAALGAAVWFNMKYSVSDIDKEKTASKYLGEAQYVDNSKAQSAVETSAKVENDYFAKAKEERNKVRKNELETLEETIKDATVKDSVKTEAVSRKAQITTQMENESAIETLLMAKNFESVVAVIGDGDINILVKKEKLTDAETLQIQDAAQSQTGFSVENIKIVNVK